MSSSSSFTINPKDIQMSSTRITIDMNYVFNATSAIIVVNFFDSSNKYIRSQQVDIPEEIYMAWSEDDNFLLDYIALQVGFTIIA
jgi:hypothetical protein